MSDKPYLLIPGAVVRPGGPPSASPSESAPTPNLQALLAALAPTDRIVCDEDAPAMPHELALARANGLPGEPGHIPWAAFETGTVGTPCAWIKPCHWQVGADQVLLAPPEDLALDDGTSRELMAAMAPYFLEDGITLHYQDGLPTAWLAQGETFRGLRTTSMERVAGTRLTLSLFNAAGGAAARLRRLQNEMQMLLYTHPANEARHQRGLAPINSFWVTGAGVLDQALPPRPGVRIETRLLQPAAHADGPAHAQAWREVDADSCASLLAQLRSGTPVQLTLCGDHAAQTFGAARTSGWALFSSVLGLQRPSLGRYQL